MLIYCVPGPGYVYFRFFWDFFVSFNGNGGWQKHDKNINRLENMKKIKKCKAKDWKHKEIES